MVDDSAAGTNAQHSLHPYAVLGFSPPLQSRSPYLVTLKDTPIPRSNLLTRGGVGRGCGLASGYPCWSYYCPGDPWWSHNFGPSHNPSFPVPKPVLLGGGIRRATQRKSQSRFRVSIKFLNPGAIDTSEVPRRVLR